MPPGEPGASVLQSVGSLAPRRGSAAILEAFCFFGRAFAEQESRRERTTTWLIKQGGVRVDVVLVSGDSHGSAVGVAGTSLDERRRRGSGVKDRRAGQA